jgi:hypothetical protein
VRWWLAIACCVATATTARADKPADVDTIALLPLDADKKLELYGQPVAAELARALRGAHVEVVVVGANMTVPERARLVVRGKIIADKGDALALSVQISDPRSGALLDSLATTAPKLTAIDRAAAELGRLVVAAVQKRLAEPRLVGTTSVPREPLEPRKPAAPPAEPTFAFDVSSKSGADPLRVALPDAIAAFAREHHAVARAASIDKLAGDAFGIALEVRELVVEPGAVPTARARVRVRIAQHGGETAWDRVVVTDTIVGDKGMATDALAARVAREVLAIVQPHLRRVVPTWR